MGLVLAIDIGTTNLKAGLIDEQGKIVCLARRQIDVERTNAGAAEHNPTKLRAALIEVCLEVTATRKSSVTLIVPSAYQFGMQLLDRQGAALTGITTLLDTRARHTHEEFKSWIDGVQLYAASGCPPFAQHALCRLFYFKQRDQQLFSRIGQILSGKAWLLKTLTGQLVSDPSTESASQMLNFATHDWNHELFERLGLSSAVAPRVIDALAESFELDPVFRDEVGLSRTVRVVPGVYDGGALAIGLGGLEGKAAVSNIGTSGMLRLASNHGQLDVTGRMRFQTYYLLQGRYLVGAAINNATAPLSWLKQNLITDDYPEIFKLMEGSVQGARGLFCLPYFTGEREPFAGHLASGVLLGLREQHTKGDVLRSLIEGVAYSLALVKETFDDHKLGFAEIRMGGGGARFEPWVQIFSDVLNARIVRAGCEEAALIGSAVLGYTHSGHFGSLAEASSALVERGKVFEPDGKRSSEYQKSFGFYKSLYQDLVPIFRKHVLHCGEPQS